MLIQEGKINVQTENIFPIIKKFLYTEQEIFLRELISNAVDATTKLKLLASQNQYQEELGDLTIKVILDEKKKTITIKDSGIGMTAEEVDRYINQIAFSSAEEFIKKLKGYTDAERAGLIGHFGLGFYSAFMVADKVQIRTKSYLNDPSIKPVLWECDGTPNYKISECDKKDRGTEVILYISDDAKEYLDEYRILDLLKKYCRFLPIPIQFGETKKSVKKEGILDKDGKEIYEEITEPRIINNTEPLWKKAPKDVTKEDYEKFYYELYPAAVEKPLFNIHINVDYPFNLTGILYFPKLKKNVEIQKDKIQLYCNQVFVTDSVENIVPDFLTLLHGVLDSPDIPLNVSRSALQTDANVRKISKHITKKVADKLEEIFNNERAEFESKWEDIKIFIEYGMISDESFSEKAMKFCLFKSAVTAKYYTFDEYKNLIGAQQTDKDNNLVILYTTDKINQHSHIEKAKEKGYDVLLLDSIIDSHFINYLEHKIEKTHFKRVDADIIEKLIEKKEQTIENKLTAEQTNKLKDLFEDLLKNRSGFTVEVQAMDENELPVIITQPEFMRRMKEMSKIGGGIDYFGTLPDNYNVIINSNNATIQKILEATNEDERKNLAMQMLDLALLSNGLLKGEDLTNFVKRSYLMFSGQLQASEK